MTLFKPSYFPNQPPTGFTSILLWHCFFNLHYYWFGHILYANLLTWTNLVLCQLQVTSSICDLTIQYFIVQKINLFLIFMLTCCIFIFIQEIFFFFLIALHGIRLLVPQPGTEPKLPAVEAWNFNHCTTSEVPEDIL